MAILRNRIIPSGREEDGTADRGEVEIGLDEGESDCLEEVVLGFKQRTPGDIPGALPSCLMVRCELVKVWSTGRTSTVWMAEPM